MSSLFKAGKRRSKPEDMYLGKIVHKAGPLKAEIRLAQAVSEFEADLSTDQKVDLTSYKFQLTKTPPTMHDVMRLTAHIDRQTSRKINGGRCFGPRLTNILQSIQQFAALGDIIIGGSQSLIACGVWSIARFALMAVVNFSSQLEKLSSLFMIAGRSAPRYDRLALLYPRSQALQSHLSEYFIVIVQLCHHVLKFMKKPALGQMVSDFVSFEVQSFQSELEQWASSIKEEVYVLNIEEQGTRFKTLMLHSKSEDNRQRLEKRVHVLDTCSTYDHQMTWKQIRKLGNASFVQQTSEYTAWKDSTGSTSLICIGKLGSGKSVLLANIVDDLNLHINGARHPVAYFFCQHDLLESLKAETIIKSLARQLLHILDDLSKADDILDGTSPYYDSETILCLLEHVLPSSFKAYFVLDGLDACDPYQKKELIKNIRRLQYSFTLHLCVSLRLEAGNITHESIEQFSNHSIVTIPEGNPDIEAFISTELESRIESGDLAITDPTVIIEIQDALMNGAQGMFLWVYLQIESLCTAKTDEAIRQTLAELPRNLPETFSHILKRCAKLGETYQTRILELITVAYRPLKAKELQEALSVVPGETEWNSARQLSDVYSALACCGSLIIVDEEDLTVRSIHHSVRQFLLSGSYICADTGAIFTEENAFRIMASIIITYMNYGIFETQVSSTVLPQVNGEAMPSKIIRSMNHVPNQARNLAIQLLRSKREPKFDLTKALEQAKSRFNSPDVYQFQLRFYATRYWRRHIGFISALDDPAQYALLLRLFQRGIFDIGARGDGDHTLVLWAVNNGDEAVFKMLIEKNSDLVNESNPDILYLAAENGCDRIFQLILKHLPFRFSWYMQEALFRAAKRGHAAIVRALFEKAPTLNSEQALFEAAESGKFEIVELLIENGTNLESQDKYGRTPLLLAAKNGDLELVQLLIEKGANLESQDEDRRTPLLLAAENGNLELVQLLIEKGANFEIQNKYGRTPLLLAAKNGNLELVQLLIENGANLENQYYFMLTLAAKNRHLAVIQLLIERSGGIEGRDTSGKTLLLLAAKNGNLNLIQLLIEKGANLESQDKYGRTPLLLAAENGNLELVQLLIEKNANLESQDKDGRTPLLLAAENGNLELVQLLIKKDANLESQDKYGRTPLLLAAQDGNLELFQLLIKKGAKLEIQDKYRRTPLLLAAENGNLELVQLLIEKDDNLEIQDKYGRTPLLLAAENGNLELVQLLIENGANLKNQYYFMLTLAVKNRHLAVVQLLIEKDAKLESQDEDRRTPLLLAAENGNLELIQLLIEKGANLEIQDEYGNLELAQLLISNGANLKRPHLYTTTALLLAAKNGNLELVQLLIKKGTKIEIQDEYGRTPLLLAAKNGNLELVQLLIEKGAKIEIQDKYGRTPLLLAAENRNLELVQLLIKNGANLEIQDEDRRTLLLLAAQNGNLELVQLLIEKGANLESQDEYGRTPLLLAAQDGNLELAQLLIEKDANLEIQDKYGRTPLLLAAENGNLELVQLLIKKGANLKNQYYFMLTLAARNRHFAVVQLLIERSGGIERRDISGKILLLLVAKNGNLELFQLLIEKGANLESQDENGRTPLLLAAKNGNLELVQLLIEKGANLESQDENGRTPLLLAAKNGNLKLVQLLIENGANLESQDKDGRTPLLLSAESGKFEIVELLIENGTNLESQEKYGRTPLLLAAKNGDLELVQLLIEKGANLESQDEYGRTPLLLAAQDGNLELAQLLIENGANLEGPNVFGTTALELAADSGHSAVAELFIEKGADSLDIFG
ncbi:hypothetical protein N7495_008995 [Penicillium taxi]|uniref:uncharacterized protein n=1 Tax=Penicillium taxi TaxID=168475 RepID=UPI002544EA1E|nr:uncharacterized protein N7495_008995 [Penicillium taxi]KAJ5888954.1 hypothetical protein N7495_008995 [Penicillium taxi]